MLKLIHNNSNIEPFGFHDQTGTRVLIEKHVKYIDLNNHKKNTRKKDSYYCIVVSVQNLFYN